MLATLIATAAPFRVWPTISPIGSPMSSAIRSAVPDTRMWATTRVGMPSGPCQLAGSVSHAIVVPMSSIVRASGRRRDRGVVGRGLRPGPRSEPALEPDEREVGDDRHDHQRHRPEDRLGEEAPPVTLEDEVAQPAEVVAEDPGHRHEPDRR